MAGRSDFNSALPRCFKRMITMGVATGHIVDAHHAGDVKALFVAAHKIDKNAKNKARTKIKNVDSADSEE